MKIVVFPSSDEASTVIVDDATKRERMAQPVRCSVIVAAYNAAEWIERVLDSLLGQTYPAECIEIIVVDDGSRDRTGEIVAERARREPRVRLIRQPNQGTAAAITAGLRAATGEILCNLSHDCYAEPSWLARVVAAFAADPRVGIVRGPILPARPIDVPFYHCTIVDHDSKSFDGACIAYRAEAVDAAGRYFDSELSRYGDDADMAWRILEHGYTHTWLSEVAARHEVVPLRFWSSFWTPAGNYRLALLLKKRPAMRSRLRLGFLWGGRYRYLKLLGLHAALLALALRRPRRAGVGVALLAGGIVWETLETTGDLRVSPAQRWLAIPVRRLLSEVLGTYAFLYGSLRYRSPIL